MSININGKATFSNVSISGIPQWQPPVGTPTITAELIYQDPTGYPVVGARSVMGINGSEIIAFPTGTEVIRSLDGGDTWTATGTLPTEPVTGNTLGVSGLQFYNGLWYVHLNQGTSKAYIASTVDGSSWTFGPSIYNGRYNAASAYIMPNGELIFGGRPSSPNHATWGRYDDEYGSSSLPTRFEVGPYNSNVLHVLPLSNGIWSMVATGSNNFDSYWVAADMSTSSFNTATQMNNYGFHASNGNNVVLQAETQNVVYRWKQEYPSGALPELPLTGYPANTGWVMLANTPDIWMAGATGGSNRSRWALHHNADQSAEDPFVYGALLQLPSSVTTANDWGNYLNIFAGPGNLWYGVYRDSVTNRLNIVRWQYGTY